MLQKLMDSRAKARSEESGFTLIELLVVIIILAILAAVVVFAVSGIGDKGQASACKIDTRTIRTAEEAFFAAPVGTVANPSKKVTPAGSYAGTVQQLVDEGFLSEPSSLHEVASPSATAAAPSFDVQIKDADAATKCGGTANAVVNGTTIF
jgi:prepilin-type N-terminal cleavage/methylation domain-containing protein